MNKFNSNAAQITDFKVNGTDENRIIANAIKRQTRFLGIKRILDVGGGLGDISNMAFADKEATILDILNYDNPINKRHKKITGNFLEMPEILKEEWDLTLFCHVLQYLDDDLEIFKNAIEQLNSKYIIAVSNSDLGDYNIIHNWLKKNEFEINPERDDKILMGYGYDKISRIKINTETYSKNTTSLAQFLLNIIFDGKANQQQIATFTKWIAEQFPSKKIQIVQSITLYKNNRLH